MQAIPHLFVELSVIIGTVRVLLVDWRGRPISRHSLPNTADPTQPTQHIRPNISDPTKREKREIAYDHHTKFQSHYDRSCRHSS